MNVKQLKEMIADLPDKTPVIVPAFDHSYRHASGYVGTALCDTTSGHLHEDFGDDHKEEIDRRFTALIIESE